MSESPLEKIVRLTQTDTVDLAYSDAARASALAKRKSHAAGAFTAPKTSGTNRHRHPLDPSERKKAVKGPAGAEYEKRRQAAELHSAHATGSGPVSHSTAAQKHFRAMDAAKNLANPELAKKAENYHRSMASTHSGAHKRARGF
jgi:hypothetical protein